MRNHIMKVRSLVAALIVSAAVVGAAGLLPGKPAFAEEKKVSKELAKTLKAAQDALNAKKYSEALAKLKEAEGNPKKTPYDEHVINMLAGAAYYSTKDDANALKAIEAQINDGFLSESEIPPRVKAASQLNYRLKNYDRAIDFGNRAIKGGYADDEMYTLVGQAYYLKGDWKGTLKFEEALIDSQVKDGKTPKKESLELALSACVKLNDAPCETRALERIVTFYPKPDYWYQLLYTLRQQTSGNDANTLQTYRLMSEV